ncbi:MAG TPA: hypothetical protein VG871_18995, partial [Vicinamibacterales bacterium]|nr:hypothetical protein [Vicinamibacterales bacterium]
ALRLQTPEGRTLKDLRDRLNPRIGFNLHNQNWRTSVGEPPRPASISVLSVAFDTGRTENAGRRMTQKLCAVVRDSLEPFASGQIGKYDEAFEVRAFGDNLTLWGTPVILIETGAYPSSEPDPPLVRLNFIGILSALDSLATGTVDKADPKRYETLPPNESKEMYIVVHDANVVSGSGIAPFLGDIGINATRRVRRVDGKREIVLASSIADVGDLRTAGALRTIDATNLVAAPLFDPSLKEGQEVRLPDWKSHPAAHTIAPGQPAALVLLKPVGDPSRPADLYRVELVINPSGTDSQSH